jgi:predicted nucleic acid-binding protein
LIKLLVLEEGSQLAEELWTRASARISSSLIYPEARAALAAAARDGRISHGELVRTVLDLDRACASMQLVGVDGYVARTGGELAERHALRGYDAVHLATALGVGDPNLAIATWDSDLASAAQREGRATIPA